MDVSLASSVAGGNEVREHQELEVPQIVLLFNNLCWRKKKPCLEDIEAARNYFDSLSSDGERALIKQHQYSDGEWVFDRVYRIVINLHPCGIASKFSQYSLIAWAGNHARMAAAERNAINHEQPQP